MRFLAALAMLTGLLALATPAEAQNRFWLQNNTGQTIVAANVSPSRIPDWGPNILARGPIRPGMQVWVEPTFPDCYLDIRVRFADGGQNEVAALAIAGAQCHPCVGQKPVGGLVVERQAQVIGHLIQPGCRRCRHEAALQCYVL